MAAGRTQLLRFSEAAARLDISEAAFRSRVARAAIPKELIIRVGARTLRVDEAAFDRWIEQGRQASLGTTPEQRAQAAMRETLESLREQDAAKPQHQPKPPTVNTAIAAGRMALEEMRR